MNMSGYASCSLRGIVILGMSIFAVANFAGCSEKAQSERSPSTWLTALRQTAKDADTLVVVIRGGCDESQSEPLTFRVTGVKDVNEILELIEIEYYTGEYVSMCGGNDTFEFLKDGKSLVTLNRTPLTALTWNSDDWKGDAVVSRAAYARIIDWFDSRGFKYFKEELAIADEAVRQQQQSDDAFVASFPPEVRQLILESNRTNGEIDTAKVTRLMPLPREGWLAICRSLGQLPETEASWTMTVPMTRAVLLIANSTEQSTFWNAVHLMGDQKPAQLGAARLYFQEAIGERETDVHKLPSILALATATLTHGSDQNKPIVMRKLATMAEPDVTEFFRKVMDGQVGTEINSARQWDKEPGIRASALIGLGMQKAHVTSEEWNRWKETFTSPSDAAAVEIGGCLLGKGTVIRPGHFRLESYTLGEAGIEALSRTPGPESLGLLTTAMEHPWAYVADSAELAIEKMIGETRERSDRRRKIDEWLATHPDSWIKPIDEKSP